MDPTLPPIEPAPVEAPPPPLDSFERHRFAPGDRPLEEVMKVANTLGRQHLTQTERARLHAVERDPRAQAATLAAMGGVPARTEGERLLELEVLSAFSDGRTASDVGALQRALSAKLTAEGKAELAAQVLAAPASRAHAAASDISAARSRRDTHLAELARRYPQR